MKNSHSESYAAAGVDVTAGYEAVERIKPMVESTYIPGVMGTLGGFGGMFAPDLTGMKKHVFARLSLPVFCPYFWAIRLTKTSAASSSPSKTVVT